MIDTKYYCQTEGCNNEIPEPRMCCNGRECGCMGMPIDPPICSEKCYDIYMSKPSKEVKLDLSIDQPPFGIVKDDK